MPPSLSVSFDASLRHAIEIMLARGASGLPVIDIEGALVGMVTKGDLMTREEIGPVLLHIPEPPLKDEEPLKKFIKGHSWRVGDVMTKSGRGLSAMCVTTIGEIFLLHHVKRVPVDTRGLDDLQRRAIQMRCRKSATNNLQGTRFFTDIRQQQGPL
ncbi:CBS domain-containing protein [Rhizobium wenxiniae]|uniref:CBS domain-containing protein n=1 Tax=Rhizobium wenxiniae TaxID=1737357 RepID=UPI003C1DAC89